MSKIRQTTQENSAVLDTIDNYLRLKNFIVPDSIEFLGKLLYLSDRKQQILEEQIVVYTSRQRMMLVNLRMSKLLFLKNIFAKAQVHTDYYYVIFVESLFDLEAVSWAKATGLWQFMAHTGKIYDLKIVRKYFRVRGKRLLMTVIDDRYDPVLITIAAAKYFKKLENNYDNYPPSIFAAYNWGETKLNYKLNKSDTDDTDKIVLPKETDEYLMGIIANKIIVEKLGFFSTFNFGKKYEQPFVNIQELEVKFKRNTDIKDIVYYFDGDSLNPDFNKFRELNPRYRYDIIPPGWQFLRVPNEKYEQFIKYLDKKKILHRKVDIITKLLKG